MDWPHAPIHRFAEATTFFITGATHRKQQFYRDAEALDLLQTSLFANAAAYDCHLQSWCLLSNHYHLVVEAAEGEQVRRMVSRFHTEAAIALNRRDSAKGRHVWFQYWDKTLTFEPSWLARLRYTHENAVHHGIVRVATEYPWCSAAWFERAAPRSLAETVRRMKIDALKVYDEFECGDSVAGTKAAALPPHS